MPTVSVIIPVYNKAAYVQRALESLSAQTFGDFEAIVVDDGSTDGSADIVAVHRDPRFRLIHQANSGPGAARNRGIAEAGGSLIGFLDADDEYLSDYLQVATRALDRHGPEVVSFTCAYIEHPGGRSSEPMWRRRGISDGVHRVTPRTSPQQLFHMLAYMSPCTTVTRAETMRRYGGFYDKKKCLFGEDAFLWLKVLLNEQILFQLYPKVQVHREASDLSANLSGPRPLEPFLEDPASIEAACPGDLLPLLERFYTLRAFRTARFWGYWGAWQQARDLRRRFRSPKDYLLPNYASSMVCSTPVGASLGRVWRALRSQSQTRNGASSDNR